MFISYILIYVLINLSTIYCKFIKQESNIIEWSKICIAKVANKYFVKYPTISIFTLNVQQDSEALEKIYSSVSHPKKLYTFTQYRFDYIDPYRYYSIVSTNNLKDLLAYDKQFHQLCLWNARSKYIFYSLTNSEAHLQQFTDLAWYYYIINAVVIMPSRNNQTLKIYSWFPYANQSCGANITAQLIDEYTQGNFKRNIDLFPRKVPENMQGCTAKIRVHISPPVVLPPEDNIIQDNKVLNISEGLEIRMMNAIASILHLNVEYYCSTTPNNWGAVTLEGNATGTIKALMDKIVDIGIGHFGNLIERRMYCDSTIPHFRDTLIWTVPTAQEVSKWRNLLQTFTVDAWLAMIAIYIFVATVICLFSKCPPADLLYKSVKNSFLFIFTSFLGLSTDKIPSKVSGKITFFFWLVFSLHFVVAYQAKLIAVLLKPTYEKQISTLEEMIDSDLEMQLLPTPFQRLFLSKAGDPRFTNILDKIGTCYDYFACLRRIAYQRDIALFTIGSLAMLESLKYKNSAGQPLIYPIPYFTNYPEWYMTKGYPLKDRINKMLYRMKDAGLIFKWEKDLQRLWLRKYKSIDDSEQQNVLTMLHLQGAFIVLIIGLSSALVVFIVEMFAKYMKNRNELFSANK